MKLFGLYITTWKKWQQLNAEKARTNVVVWNWTTTMTRPRHQPHQCECQKQGQKTKEQRIVARKRDAKGRFAK